MSDDAARGVATRKLGVANAEQTGWSGEDFTSDWDRDERGKRSRVVKGGI